MRLPRLVSPSSPTGLSRLRDGARDVEHLDDLLERQLGGGGDLLGRRLAAERHRQAARSVVAILRSRWATWTGRRIVRPLSAMPRWIAWRIHSVA